MVVFSIPGEVGAEMVFIVRVLFDGVEQRHFLLLLISQVLSTVVPLLIVEFNFIQNFLYFSPVFPVQSVKGGIESLVFHPLRSFGIKIAKESTFPGQRIAAVVLASCIRLLSNMLLRDEEII